MKLNVIVPLYNEEGNIDALFKSLSASLKSVKYTITFIDDGSTDNSYNILSAIYSKNKSIVRVIRFSRNFGKEAAMLAGLNVSKAQYTCIIDADLQQDPKYIMDMMKFLDENTDYDEVAMVNDYAKEKASQKFLKKTLAVCMIGFGLGVLLVLLLPITGWLFIIGVLVVIVGLIWLSC